ncbi:MAG: hypothetical protein D6819_09460 [Gammaproteobacteria bacterium]|nr:MAG: hypothetical protein D6819_09460 [Gammaproteobacteria bacterium]
MKDDTALEQLRTLIGQRVLFEGYLCRVIEVLEDGPSLVLLDTEKPNIQPNQYGEAHRLAPRTFTVPVWDEEQGTLHPQFLELEFLEP